MWFNARKMKSKPITEATRTLILEAAWRLIAERRDSDVSQSEIARAAGVSRQTVFYAFGNRTGLLTAMLRNHDDKAQEVREIARFGRADPVVPETLLAYMSAWLDYLPAVYPVGSLLDAAGLTDPDARAAIDDRMTRKLHSGFRRLLRCLDEAGELAAGKNADEAADELWCALHFPAWRLLVVERGWSPEAFRASRIALARTMLRRA